MAMVIVFADRRVGHPSAVANSLVDTGSDIAAVTIEIAAVDLLPLLVISPSSGDVVSTMRLDLPSS